MVQCMMCYHGVWAWKMHKDVLMRLHFKKICKQTWISGPRYSFYVYDRSVVTCRTDFGRDAKGIWVHARRSKNFQGISWEDSESTCSYSTWAMKYGMIYVCLCGWCRSNFAMSHGLWSYHQSQVNGRDTVVTDQSWWPSIISEISDYRATFFRQWNEDRIIVWHEQWNVIDENCQRPNQ